MLICFHYFLLDFDFTFIQNPKSLTAVVGDDVSLHCVPPTSFPVLVNIRWYHNYQQIVPGGDIFIDSSGTIKFTSITKSEEGMYFCDGTNSHLHVTRTSLQAYVTVHGKWLTKVFNVSKKAGIFHFYLAVYSWGTVFIIN